MRTGLRLMAAAALLLLALSPTFAWAQAARGPSPADGRGIRWVEVEGGTFRMGDGNSAREVTVGDFMISATEVTFAQYDAFCGATGKPKPADNGWGRGDRPVINASWDDIQQYCRWLSQETGTHVRLPNEAEWEYAARGGRQSRGFAHSGSNNADEVSWNETNSGGKTHPVGTKKPNELGLYDMNGNVWEWCLDWDARHPDGAAATAADAAKGIKRAGRGNSYDNPARAYDLWLSVRANVDAGHANAGFRVVKTK